MNVSKEILLPKLTREVNSEPSGFYYVREEVYYLCARMGKFLARLLSQ